MKTNGNIISRSTLSKLSEYWLFNNGKYIYYRKYFQTPLFLPTIGIEYKSILEKNGIPYRHISCTDLEFWDKNCYEEVEITLPTFIYWGDGYRQVKKHTGSIVTKETLEAAIALNVNVVRPAIDELSLEQFKENLVNMLLDAMGKSNVAVIEAPSFHDLGIKVVWNRNGRNLKIFRVISKLRYFPYWIAFDMDKMPANGLLEIQVPEGKEGLFIGANGWQIKKWSKELGLKCIQVKSKS